MRIQKTIPNLLFDATITLIQKSGQRLYKTADACPYEYRCKILNKIYANIIQQYVKRIIHMTKLG